MTTNSLDSPNCSLYNGRYTIIRLHRFRILCYDGKTISADVSNSDPNNQKHSRFHTAEDAERHSDNYMADMHKIYNKFRNPLKILGARRETGSKFHNEHPQILGVKAQNLVAMATWRPGFVPLRYTVYQFSRRRIPES